MRGRRNDRHSMILAQRYFGFGKEGQRVRDCRQMEVWYSLLHREVEDKADPRF